MRRTSAKLPLEGSLARRIDECCDRFEAAWKTHCAPDVRGYLNEFAEADWPCVLHELLTIDLAYRRNEQGKPLSRREFLEVHRGLAAFLGDDFDAMFATFADVDSRAAERHSRTRRGQDGRDGHDTRHDSQGLHIRCPHCQNAVELLADDRIDEITCGACGDSFSLVGKDESDAPPMKCVGRFELSSRLGVGGFGSVWRAVDRDLDRVVAVKIPRRGQLSPRETEQFLREARAAAQLKHPNIVPVHEVGRDGALVFIVSDLIRGESLANRLENDAPTAREAAQLCATIADALHFAHRQGVVHRDLKPSNVMVDTTGQPHLMDFGLAKREIAEVTMTADGQILGTPAYMSPEQAMGRAQWIDRRTDIYSLGVVMFELLTRELPYRGGVQRQIQQRISEDAPNPRKLNPHVPEDLATICLKCLERDPNRRFATAAELSDELHRFLRGEPIHSRPISAPERAWRWAKRNPPLAVAAALTALLAIVGPLAAVTIEQGRRTIRSQLGTIQSQLDERNSLIARYERERDAQKRATAEQHETVGENADNKKAGADWRKLLVTDYLADHEADVKAALTTEPMSKADRARGYIGLAMMQREAGRPEDAIDSFAVAASLLETLASRDTAPARYREVLADCLTQIGALERTKGNLSAAAKHAERAEAIRKELTKLEPASGKYQLDYFDAIMRSDNRQTDAVDAAGLQQIQHVRETMRRGWSVAPNAVYELGCYLAGEAPVLDEREAEAERTD